MSDRVIDNVIRSQIVEDYLDFFESKDINGITEVFSDDCLLTDWNIGTIIGKQNVINFFSGIFTSVNDIDTNISHIHEDINGILICEMVLSIDGEEMLVADIFEFDDKDRIKSLRAYKGS